MNQVSFRGGGAVIEKEEAAIKTRNGERVDCREGSSFGREILGIGEDAETWPQ